jgi:precorrin-2 dehydrogenase / sirohydrochlorin ferrochelatase
MGLGNPNTPYYAAFLNLVGKVCVVIGGGRVAERKIAKLIESKAEVVVISQEIRQRIEEWVHAGCVLHIARDYKEGDIKDAFLVFAATNCRDVNQRVFEEASRLGKLVNVVDDRESCSFVVPATYGRDELQIAISTSGTSPAKAKKMRERLEHDIENGTSTFIHEISTWNERG